MNSAAAPTTQKNSLPPPSNQMGASAPPQNLGYRAPQAPYSNLGVNQQVLSSNTAFMRPPQAAPSPSMQQMPGVNRGLTGGGVAGPTLPGSNTMGLATDWFGNKSAGGSVGSTTQPPLRGITPSQRPEGFGLALSSATAMTPRPPTQSITPSVLPTKPLDPMLPTIGQAANGSKPLVVSENSFSSASGLGGNLISTSSQAMPIASTLAFSANSMPNSSSLPSVSSNSQNVLAQLDPIQSTTRIPPGGTQLQQTKSGVNNIQSTPVLPTSNVSAGLASSSSGQSQVQWPKIAQSDIQKYTKVFVEVDKDRDGKITGEQARNLFLSWRLPREVLKQVWDLSDQDNDSMLSLREFCIALYLMERYREGCPLPAMLPDSLKYDETLLRATGLPATTYGGPTWQPNAGFPQGIPGARPVVAPAGIRPPIQTYMPSQIDAAVQPGQQKPRMPGLDNYVVDQISKDKQSTERPEHQEATDSGKKVQEMEKQILDSKEKIEFYRNKMQDLVLYKSRCDNRLNEIAERASADKREVELLGKKYEEKYKQVGEIASQLAVQEVTFRDVQERKLELHNAIVKMEQGGSADGLLQVRADRIQNDLEELEKALGERCKQFGLHVKPATSIELPFGWQPGAQEGAVDWDEDWDKFEDEGFVLVKGLNEEVQNALFGSMDEFSPSASSSNGHLKNEKHYNAGERATETEATYEHSEEEARSSGSSGRSPFHSSQFGVHDNSPRTKDSYSDHDGAESRTSGNKYDEPSWTFEDTDSVWGSNAMHTTEDDHQGGTRNSFSGSGDFGLNPLRVDSPSAASVFGKGKRSPFFEDSVPSSPAFNSGFGFSPKFNESRDDNSFGYGRFDSFKTQDSGFFPQDKSFARSDSMSSTKDDRFSRFDSISSSRNFGHSRGFESFDEADPFGSTGPFKSSGSH
ncbi:epidermal growth factor receptor substrate 15-like isoform X2 [Ananas comosus]|nr:epidermal growth factor receptor substrate 15-like isoform X2 [Ananas comosus]